MSILRFLYQFLCAFLQIKDRKHIEQNFHSVAGVMPLGWDLGVLGWSKTLTWGFAMAPPRLRILVSLSPRFFFKKSEGDIVIATVRPSIRPFVRYAISS